MRSHEWVELTRVKDSKRGDSIEVGLCHTPGLLLHDCTNVLLLLLLHDTICWPIFCLEDSIQTSAAQQVLIRWTHNLIAFHVFNINALLILLYCIFNQLSETFYVENCLSNALVQGSKEPVTNVHSVWYVILSVFMIMAPLYHRDRWSTSFLSYTPWNAI